MTEDGSLPGEGRYYVLFRTDSFALGEPGAVEAIDTHCGATFYTAEYDGPEEGFQGLSLSMLTHSCAVIP